MILAIYCVGSLGSEIVEWARYENSQEHIVDGFTTVDNSVYRELGAMLKDCLEI